MRTIAEARREARALFFRANDSRLEPEENLHRGLTVALNRLSLTHIGDSRVHLALTELETSSAAELASHTGASLHARETADAHDERIQTALAADRNAHERRYLLSNEFSRSGDPDLARQQVERYESLRRHVVKTVTRAAFEFVQPGKLQPLALNLDRADFERVFARAMQKALPVVPPQREYGEPEPDPQEVALFEAMKGGFDAVVRKAGVAGTAAQRLGEINAERARLMVEKMRAYNEEGKDSPRVASINDRQGEKLREAFAVACEHFGRLGDAVTYLHADKAVYPAVRRAMEREFGGAEGPGEGAV
jgi:hypothetical protein